YHLVALVTCCEPYFDLVFVFIFVSFFFQAEDGIRDGHVTGVQTCALPISDAFAARLSRENVRRRIAHCLSYEQLLGRRATQLSRSEERRVGKSVDIGGRRIIKKKKKKEKREQCQKNNR